MILVVQAMLRLISLEGVVYPPNSAESTAVKKRQGQIGRALLRYFYTPEVFRHLVTLGTYLVNKSLLLTSDKGSYN